MKSLMWIEKEKGLLFEIKRNVANRKIEK